MGKSIRIYSKSFTYFLLGMLFSLYVRAQDNQNTVDLGNTTLANAQSENSSNTAQEIKNLTTGFFDSFADNISPNVSISDTKFKESAVALINLIEKSGLSNSIVSMSNSLKNALSNENIRRCTQFAKTAGTLCADSSSGTIQLLKQGIGITLAAKGVFSIGQVCQQTSDGMKKLENLAMTYITICTSAKAACEFQCYDVVSSAEKFKLKVDDFKVNFEIAKKQCPVVTNTTASQTAEINGKSVNCASVNSYKADIDSSLINFENTYNEMMANNQVSQPGPSGSGSSQKSRPLAEKAIEKKAVCGTYSEALAGLALKVLPKIVQSRKDADQCVAKYSTDNCADPKYADTPACICKRSPGTKGCANSDSQLVGSGNFQIRTPSSDTNNTASVARPGSDPDQFTSPGVADNRGGGGPAAPSGGGSGGATASDTSNKGGAQGQGAAAAGKRSSDVYAGEGGGGGGGGWGSSGGSSWGSAFDAYKNKFGLGRDSNGKLLSGQIDSIALQKMGISSSSGKDNFEKIRRVYTDTKSTLIKDQ